METKCTVCNQGVGHVLCDECGKPVCFNCFHFANSRRLCTTCVNEWETKRRWQTYAARYSSLSVDEQAGLWATLSSEERVMLEGELTASGEVPSSHRGGVVRRYGWFALPLLACLVVFLVFTDGKLWKEALVAGKKLGAEVESLTGSVGHEVLDLTSAASRRAAEPSQQPGPVLLVSEYLRKNGLPITAKNLQMKANPAGEGIIVYSPHSFGPSRRLAWIVIDDNAYSLSQASQELTPSLQTARAVPARSWKKTGLSREKALTQVESSLWD